MKRSQLLQIGCTALIALSCGAEAPTGVVLPALLSEATAPAQSESVPAPLVDTPDPRHEALVEFLAGRPTGLTRSELSDVAAAITEEVDRHDLDLQLILALMYVESRYQTFIVSPVGAMGLMQILPATGEELAHRLGIEWYGPETLFDPVVNVRLGITYVKQLTRRYGKVSTALAAYNWGMGTIDKRLRHGNPVPKVYPSLIMDAYHHTVLPVRS